MKWQIDVDILFIQQRTLPQYYCLGKKSLANQQQLRTVYGTILFSESLNVQVEKNACLNVGASQIVHERIFQLDFVIGGAVKDRPLGSPGDGSVLHVLVEKGPGGKERRLVGPDGKQALPSQLRLLNVNLKHGLAARSVNCGGRGCDLLIRQLLNLPKKKKSQRMKSGSPNST